MIFGLMHTMLISFVLIAFLLLETNARAPTTERVITNTGNRPKNVPIHSGDVFQEIDDESNSKHQGENVNHQVVVCWIETTTLVIKGDSLEEVVREYAVAVETNSNLDNFNFNTAGSMYSSYDRDGPVVTLQGATQTTVDGRSRTTIKRVKCVEGPKFKKTFIAWPDSLRKGVQISTLPVTSICESDWVNESKGGNCSEIVEKLHSKLDPLGGTQKNGEATLESDSDSNDQWDLEHFGLKPLAIPSTFKRQDSFSGGSSDSTQDESTNEDKSDTIPNNSENKQLDLKGDGNSTSTTRPKSRRLTSKLPQAAPMDAATSVAHETSKPRYDTKKQRYNFTATSDSCHCCCDRSPRNKNLLNSHDVLALKFTVNYDEDLRDSPTIKIETQTEVHGKDDFEKIEQNRKIKTFLSEAFKSFVQQLANDGILDRRSSNVSHNRKFNTIFHNGNVSNVDSAINEKDYEGNTYQINEDDNQSMSLLQFVRENDDASTDIKKDIMKKYNEINNRKKNSTQSIDTRPKPHVTSATNLNNDEESNILSEVTYGYTPYYEGIANHRLTNNANLDINTTTVKDIEENESDESRGFGKSLKRIHLKNMDVGSNQDDNEEMMKQLQNDYAQNNDYKKRGNSRRINSANKRKMNNSEDEIIETDYNRQDGKLPNAEKWKINKIYNEKKNRKEYYPSTDSRRIKIPRRLENLKSDKNGDQNQEISSNNAYLQNKSSRQSDKSRGGNMDNVDANKSNLESSPIKYYRNKEEYMSHESVPQHRRSYPQSLPTYDYYGGTDRRGSGDSRYRDTYNSEYDAPYAPEQPRFYRMASYSRQPVSGQYDVPQKMLLRPLQQQRAHSYRPSYEDYDDIPPQILMYSLDRGSALRRQRTG